MHQEEHAVRGLARAPWFWMSAGLVLAFLAAMILPWLLSEAPGLFFSPGTPRRTQAPGYGTALYEELTQPEVYWLNQPAGRASSTGQGWSKGAYRIPWTTAPPPEAGLPLPQAGRLYRPWLRPVLPPAYIFPRLGSGGGPAPDERESPAFTDINPPGFPGLRLAPFVLFPLPPELSLSSLLATLPSPAPASEPPAGVPPGSTGWSTSHRDEEMQGGEAGDESMPAGNEGARRSTRQWQIPRPALTPVFGFIRRAARYSPLPPGEVRGLHASSNQAGSARMTSIVRTAEQVGLNAVVVEIKDEFGRLAYQSRVPLAREIGAGTDRIPDVRAFLADLHERGFYVIARMVTFQDGKLAEGRPELAIRRRSGGIWRNSQGLAWVDPGLGEVWRYEVDIAEEALQLGFDEVQFDYVRFPTDGNISDVVSVVPASQRVTAIAAFLDYAKERLAPYGRPVSADVFGFVATAEDDLGIGQHLEEVARSMDFVSPMVYPSHYPKGSYGFADPDAEPYGVIRHALGVAAGRIGTEKLRPWLQSFSLRHVYGPEEIAAQLRAVHETGISSWLFWNASGRYNLLEGLPPL